MGEFQLLNSISESRLVDNHHIKPYLLLILSLVVAGCSRQAQDNREVLAKLDEIKSDLAVKRPEKPRWALANKREIDSAVSQWNRARMEEFKKSEGLSPDIEEKIRKYEALEREFIQKQIASRRLMLPPRAGAPEPAVSDADYLTLSNRVAEAKAPVADIIERRNRQSSQYREQFTADKLVGEYAKDRFDLVIDSSEQTFGRSPVLYGATAEALDITEAVIRLFNQKPKP